MEIFKRAHFVDSVDGIRRIKLVWKPKKFTHFATIDEIKDTIRQLLVLLKEEERYFAGKVGGSSVESNGDTSQAESTRSTIRRS